MRLYKAYIAAGVLIAFCILYKPQAHADEFNVVDNANQVATVIENETIAIQVCHAVTTVTVGAASAATNNDPALQFAQTIVRGGTANPISGPFHGYYFRVVGQELAGLVLVAYPAEYRVSGVMTFLVAGGGRVYEKDLGPTTEAQAQQIQAKPSKKWKPVQQSAVTGPSEPDILRCLAKENCEIRDLRMGQADRLFGSPINPWEGY